MPIKRWEPEKLLEAVTKEQAKRMGVAVALVVRTVKKSLNRSNRGGTSPSLPSEAPKKVTGRLQQSITGQVIRQGKDQVIGVVGTNMPYGRRLELGFYGSDSQGRKIRQGPRPYLRPGVTDNKAELKRILGGK